MRIKLLTTAILVVLIAAFGSLCYRLVYLQYLHNDEFANRFEKQRRAIINLQPRRGLITDRKGTILAASDQLKILFAEPRVIKEPRLVADILSEIILVPSEQIFTSITESKNPGYAKLFTGLNLAQYQAVKEANLYGIGIHTGWERFYPTGSAGSHVVGFVSKYEQAGLGGIELTYNSKLCGIGGKNILVVDSRRRPIGMLASDERIKEAKDGCNLVLTIDSTIQQFTRTAIQQQIKDFNAESGVAIVIDPFTGEIYSLVSIPDFTPDKFSESPTEFLRNRALTDPFEPGSIFKPIITAIALDAGVINYNDVIDCEHGSYSGKGFGTIGEWGSHHFDDMTIKQILVKSSNIGVAKIGQKMGKKMLYDGVKMFGFGAKTGIDIPGENSGIVRDLHKWDGYSVTRVPFGHEVTVTVLQIARAYCILANGGSLITPHIVQAVYENDGTITKYPMPSTLAGRVLKPEVADWIVKDALVSVVKEGTGKKAALDDWQVFGKTGTADIAGQTGRKGYGDKYHVASFAGGAPADHPKVIVVVAINKPDRSLGKGYTGGSVAAPVVKKILEKTLTYLEQ